MVKLAYGLNHFTEHNSDDMQLKETMSWMQLLRKGPVDIPDLYCKSLELKTWYDNICIIMEKYCNKLPALNDYIKMFQKWIKHTHFHNNILYVGLLDLLLKHNLKFKQGWLKGLSIDQITWNALEVRIWIGI